MEYAAGSELSQALSLWWDECLMRIVQSKYFSAKPSAFSAASRFDLVACHSQAGSRAPLENLGQLLENHFKEWYTRRDSNP